MSNGTRLPLPNRAGYASAHVPPEDRQREIGSRVDGATGPVQGPNMLDNGEETPLPRQAPANRLNRQDETPTFRTDRQDKNKTKTKRVIRKTKAHIKIASLNMRGVGSNQALDPNNKWNTISYLMRDKKIGVLALQETHLDEDATEALHRTYGKRLQIFHTADPTNPTQRAGVAIVINKQIANVKGIKTKEIKPGRALLLEIPWHGTLKLHILAIYAPNSLKENAKFWNDISEKWDEERLTSPDLILGDFNLIEDMIDRLPAHTDDPDATAELMSLKQRFQMIDGWRNFNETKRGYTYTQDAINSHSRIDCIYITERLKDHSSDWLIKHTSVPTDHRLVTTTIIDRKSPYIGPGRWDMLRFLLKDKSFMKDIIKMGAAVNKNVSKATQMYHTQANNPQKIFP